MKRNGQRGRGVAYSFWVLIEETRARRGLSKRALAQASGIPASTMDNLATSTRPPLPRVVNALIDALGLDRDEAYRLAGTTPQPDEPDGGPETLEDLCDRVRRNPRLSDARKKMILSLIEAQEALHDTPDGDGKDGREQAG
jgi:transcriptional regulator with XRE-family HTH domain